MAAAALIEKPALHAEQSSAEAVSHNVAPDPVAMVAVPPTQVQTFATPSATIRQKVTSGHNTYTKIVCINARTRLSLH